MNSLTTKKECPNCRNKSLEFVLGEWVCQECEYHTRKGKPISGSFR